MSAADKDHVVEHLLGQEYEEAKAWLMEHGFRRRVRRRRKAFSWDYYIASRIEKAWHGSTRPERFRRFPAPVRDFLYIQLAQGLIGNGGVWYFLQIDLPQGSRYGECARAFRLIGAGECAAGLEDVYRLFPGGVPARYRERWPIVESFTEQQHDVLDRADEAFYQQSDANYRKAAARFLCAPHLLRPVKVRQDPKKPADDIRPI